MITYYNALLLSSLTTKLTNLLTLGKGLDGIVEDDMLFNTKLSKTICPLLQGNRASVGG